MLPVVIVTSCLMVIGGLLISAPKSARTSSRPPGRVSPRKFSRHHRLSAPSPTPKPRPTATKTTAPTAVPTKPVRHSTPADPIKHVIIIVRENHSFDNMFGRFPGADGTRLARVGSKTKPLGVTPDRVSHDLGHGGNSAVVSIDGGRMNDFYKVVDAFQNGHDIADSQYPGSELPVYCPMPGTTPSPTTSFRRSWHPAFPTTL